MTEVIEYDYDYLKFNYLDYEVFTLKLIVMDNELTF